MTELQCGVTLDVNRGPNWLFFRLESGTKQSIDTLATDLWDVVSKHFVYRVVLEFDQSNEELPAGLIKQLDLFRSKLEDHDGALRVCGLNQDCADRLAKHCAESRTKSRILSHSSVAHAVFGTEQNESSPKPHIKMAKPDNVSVVWQEH